MAEDYSNIKYRDGRVQFIDSRGSVVKELTAKQARRRFEGTRPLVDRQSNSTDTDRLAAMSDALKEAKKDGK